MVLQPFLQYQGVPPRVIAERDGLSMTAPSHSWQKSDYSRILRLTTDPEAHRWSRSEVSPPTPPKSRAILFGRRALEHGQRGGMIQSQSIPRQSSIMRSTRLSSSRASRASSSPERSMNSFMLRVDDRKFDRPPSFCRQPKRRPMSKALGDLTDVDRLSNTSLFDLDWDFSRRGSSYALARPTLKSKNAPTPEDVGPILSPVGHRKSDTPKRKMPRRQRLSLPTSLQPRPFTKARHHRMKSLPLTRTQSNLPWRFSCACWRRSLPWRMSIIDFELGEFLLKERDFPSHHHLDASRSTSGLASYLENEKEMVEGLETLPNIRNRNSMPSASLNARRRTASTLQELYDTYGSGFSGETPKAGPPEKH